MAGETIRLGLDVGDVVAKAKQASEALRQVAGSGDAYDVLTESQQKVADAMARSAAAFLAEAESEERAATEAAGLVAVVDRAADAYRVLSSAEVAASSSGIALVEANAKLASGYDVVGVTISKAAADVRELVQSQKLLVLSTAEVAAAVEAAADRETAAAVEATRAQRIGSQMAAEAAAEMARRSKEAEFEARRASYGVGTLSDMFGKLSEDSDAYTAKTRKFRSGIDDVAKGVDRASRSTANMGRTMLETGRVVQDFTQGGIAGILNNIEGLTVALGGGAGLAGALTVAGVGYFVFKEQLKDLYAVMVSGDKEISTQTDFLGRLNDELDSAKTRVKELREQRRVSNDEDAEYRTLLGDVVRLERDANEERARRAELDKARKEEETKDYDKGSADAAKKAIEGLGGVNDAVQAARNALAATSPELKRAKENLDNVEKENQSAAENPWNPIAQLKALTAMHVARRRRDEAARNLETEADDLVAKARQGSPEASGRLDSLIPDAGFFAASSAGREQQKRNETEQRNYERKQEIREDAAKQADEDWKDAEAEFTKAEKAEESFVKAKAKRFAKYRDEMAVASKSTPEEERLSDALDAVAERMKRGTLSSDLTDAEQLKIAKIAVDASVDNRRLSGSRAIDMGIRAVGDDRAKAKDAADVADDEREIDRATGGRLSHEQIQGATQRMRQLVGQGFNTMAAMEAAVNELLQTQGEFINKVFSINSGMNALAGQARFQKQQVRAIKQMESSYLSRGG